MGTYRAPRIIQFGMKYDFLEDSMKAFVPVFLLIVLVAAAPARAHHAFAAEFDAKNCADVTGVLTKVAYENPHAYCSWT